MFITQTLIKRKIRSLVWKIFNSIENNGNSDFDRNGEKFWLFLISWGSHYMQYIRSYEYTNKHRKIND